MEYSVKGFLGGDKNTLFFKPKHLEYGIILLNVFLYQINRWERILKISVNEQGSSWKFSVYCQWDENCEAAR